MTYFRNTSKAVSLLSLFLVLGVGMGVYAYYHRQPQQVAQTTPPTTITTAPSSATPVTSLPSLPAGWKTYTDPDFHLSFGYPSSWNKGGIDETQGAPDNPVSRSGGFGDESGVHFFYITNTYHGTPASLDEIVDMDIHSPTRKPGLPQFGSSPTVKKLSIAGQDARLVFPSADSKRQDRPVLYIKCPGTSGIFYMEASKSDIEQIIQTMKLQ